MVINRAGVHLADEFHNGIAKLGIAGENGGLDRGSAAIFRQQGRMKIENTLRLKEVEQVGLDEDAKGSQNTESVGMLSLNLGDFGEVGSGAGVEEKVDVVF